MIATEAAKNLTQCVFELGGKSPIIVDESADVDWAASKIMAGSFLNCG